MNTVNKRESISLYLIVGAILISLLISVGSYRVHASTLSKHPIYRVNRDTKDIALTFDINWAENEYLYDILKILDKYNIKGTFFVMGGWLNYTEENKEKLIMIKEGGHEIGNHSYSHPSFSKISSGMMIEELRKTEDAILNTIGVKTKLFRFPSGDYNEEAVRVIEGTGYKCIQWDVDSVDWKELGEDIEYQRVIKNVKPGSIVLFHNNARYTPNNLIKIINKLKEDGYSFITVGQLLYEDNYYIDENGEQIKK